MQNHPICYNIGSAIKQTKVIIVILLFAIGVLFVLKRMRIIMKIFAREVSQTYVRVAWVVRVVLVIKFVNAYGLHGLNN